MNDFIETPTDKLNYGVVNLNTVLASRTIKPVVTFNLLANEGCPVL